MSPWTSTEDQIIRDGMDMDDLSIATKLTACGTFRTETAVRKRRQALRLVKTRGGGGSPLQIEKMMEALKRAQIAQAGWPAMPGSQKDRDRQYQKMMFRALSLEGAKP